MTDVPKRQERSPSLRKRQRMCHDTMVEMQAEKVWWHLGDRREGALFGWTRVPVDEDHYASPMRAGFLGNQLAQRCLCCGDAAVLCAVFEKRPFSTIEYYIWACGCGTVTRIDEAHKSLLLRLMRLVDGGQLRHEDRSAPEFRQAIAEANTSARNVAAGRERKAQ